MYAYNSTSQRFSFRTSDHFSFALASATKPQTMSALKKNRSGALPSSMAFGPSDNEPETNQPETGREAQ
ncbi:MAG: hypothetical protein DME22_11995 [Verrucomicrobia bacterium]|nr:MAG: hypothetical protein DME22_11995 [Verrucomicrobiota bacterium]